MSKKGELFSVLDEGVVVMKGDKFWGELYADGQCTAHGWTDNVKKVKMSDGKYLTKPEELTYTDSPDVDELRKGKIVKVRKAVVIEIME